MDSEIKDKGEEPHFCSADACFLQDLSWSWPQSTRLSICSRSSSQVMTPGVESGGTNPSHCAQLGYAPTSLHMSSHIPASLFCTCVRILRSVATHAFSSLFTTLWRNTDEADDFEATCSAEACFLHALS